MLKSKACLFIFVFLQVINLSYASIKKNPEISKKEFDKISLYFNYLSKGVHKSRLTKKVRQVFIKLGDEFKEELLVVNQQIEINRKPFNSSNCNTNLANFSSSVSKYHYLQVLRFCHKELVKNKKEEDLSKNEISFIKNFYSALVETENVGLIRLRTKRTVFPKALAEVLSLKKFDVDEITTLFQRTYASRHLNYGRELTKHLQTTGLFPSKESRLFRREFKNLCSKFLNSKDHIKRLRFLEEILSFYSENKTLIGYRYSNKKFRQISRRLSRSNQIKDAKRFITRSIQSQSEKYRAPLYFERIYLDIVRGDYKSAMKYINRSGLLGMENNYDSKLRYWIGRVFLKNNEKSLAEFLFKTQVTKNPLSYYSILSTAHLKKLGLNSFLEKNYLYNIDNGITSLGPSINKDDKTQLERLRVWLKSDSQKLAALEIREILSKPRSNQIGRGIASKDSKLKTSFQILKLFQEEDDYLSSFKFFSRNRFVSNLDFLPTTTKILFPTPYLNKIKRYSKNMDPVLLLALIRQESAFDPRAKSSAGARGLMQLMPNTARIYKKRLRKSDLYRPKLNLSIGSRYLNYLYKKYDKSLIHTLASYNAGETNLRRWKTKYLNMEDDLLKVESIPFEETEKYVKYITRNIFFYKIIFGEPLLAGLEWIKDSI